MLALPQGFIDRQVSGANAHQVQFAFIGQRFQAGLYLGGIGAEMGLVCGGGGLPLGQPASGRSQGLHLLLYVEHGLQQFILTGLAVAAQRRQFRLEVAEFFGVADTPAIQQGLCLGQFTGQAGDLQLQVALPGLPAVQFGLGCGHLGPRLAHDQALAQRGLDLGQATTPGSHLQVYLLQSIESSGTA
mgnify:CR=1 FL=1